MPGSLKKLHDAGYVGAGKPSFYADPRSMTPDQTVMDHIALDSDLPTPTREEAQDILILGMANEAFFCLEEGVLKDYHSMDLGAVLGIGFPDCWHGPARYVGHLGVGRVRDRLIELHDKFGIKQLKPAGEFERLVACGVDTGLI
jgi:3-hydroxyacyl-CoA dehydrogenase/enoyl-CoA hydratase/3-hydroxybutyryl-CoA epimerase